MRTALCLLTLALIVCGCSRNAPEQAAPAKNARLPVEVEKGPEEALPKKWARPGKR